MRRLAIVLMASSAMSLSLAELGAAAPLYRSTDPVPYNWTGFYIGAHFGGGWGRKDWSEPNTSPSSGFSGACNFDGFGCLGRLGSGAGSHTVTGPLGGFQAGYNYQVGQLLFGVEGQFSWSSLKGDHQNVTASAASAVGGCFDGFCSTGFINATQADRFYTKVKDLGTIAARLGLVSGPQDRMLFYVKGGAAYANDDYSVLSSGSLTQCSTFVFGGSFCGTSNLSQTLAGSQTRWGYMVGVGFEFALFGSWTAKVEYDYLGLGTQTVSLSGLQCIDAGCAALTRTFNIGQDIQLVKFGINYRFGYAALGR